MQRSAVGRRALLFLAAAVLSAVMGDYAIENGAHFGLYGQSFASHDQRSVICTATAGLVLVSAAALVSLIERIRPPSQSSNNRDWLAEAAHHIATTLSWRALPPAFIVAILVRYTMESAEVVQQTGHLPTGFDWLGGPLFIALAVHAVCGALALIGLALVMRGLDRTVQTLACAIFALLTAIAILLPTNGPTLVRRQRHRAVDRLLLLARHLGERGPPYVVAV